MEAIVYATRKLDIQLSTNMRSHAKPSDPPMTVAEAARALGLSVHTIRAWIKQRKLTHIRLGRAIRILPSELKEVLESCTVQASNRRPQKDRLSPPSIDRAKGRKESFKSSQLSLSYNEHSTASLAESLPQNQSSRKSLSDKDLGRKGNATNPSRGTNGALS